MAEGKVGSLFVEFRATVDKFAADMQQMSGIVQAFDKTIDKVSKNIGSLGGNVSSGGLNELIRLIGVANKEVSQLAAVSGFDRLISSTDAAAKKLTVLTDSESKINQFINSFERINTVSASLNKFEKEIQSVSNRINALGSSGSLGKSNPDLTANFNAVNAAAAAKTAASMSAAMKSAVASINSSSFGGLTSGLNLASTVASQAAAGMRIALNGTITAANTANASVTGLTAGFNAASAAATQAAAGINAAMNAAAGNAAAVTNTAGLAAGLNAVNVAATQAAAGINAALNVGLANTFIGRMQAASAAIRQFDRFFAPIQRLLNQVGFALTAGLTAPIIAAGAYSLKVGMEFETAFSGVRQVLDADESQLATLRRELINLSTTAPTTAAQFANIATSAAKLGIEAPSIAKFGTTVNELSAITNLSADAASNFLARFTNLTHLPQDQIHNLGATLFALGKAFPGLETEIGNFALRVARTGTFVNLTSGQILAFATALSSVGVTAEAGGTALSTVLAEIAKASEKLDSTKLAQFASVAGQSAAQFAKSFKTDAAGAVLDFVRGLQRIKDQGGDVFTTLDALHLGARRTRETILALAAGDEQLARALIIQGDQLRSNGEFTRAYGEKLKTTESQLQIFKNQVDALGISLFDAIAPVINGTVLPALKSLIDNGIRPALDAFEHMTPSGQHFVEAMVVIAAATGPAILAITKLTSFVVDLTILLDKLKVGQAITGLLGGQGLGGVIGILTTPVTIPWWLTAAFIAGVATEVYNLAKGYEELIRQQNNAVQSQAGANAALFANIERLKKQGFDIPTQGKSIEDLEQLVHNIVSAMGKINPAFASIKPPANLGPSAEEIEATAKAAAKLAEEHHKLAEKFVDELTPATKLNEELDYLLKYFSADEVIAVYGKRIVDATDAQHAHGIAVGGASAKYYDQAKAIETAHDRLKDMLKDLSKDVPTIHMQIPGITGGVLVPSPTTSPLEIKALEQFNQFSGAKEEINKLDLAIKNLSFLGPDVELKLFGKDLKDAGDNAKFLHVQLPPNIQDLLDYEKATQDAADGLKAWQDIAHAGKKTFDEMTTQVSATSASLHEMLDDPAGFATAQIFDLMGAAIDKLAENARILKIDLDPVIADLVKMREEMKADAKETSDLGKEMKRVTTEVTAKIVNDLSQGIADALLGSKGLGDLGKKLGQDFAAAFIKAAVAHIAAQLTKKLTEAAEKHPVIAAAVVTVAVVASVVRALSDSHLFANQFVKETQNPFGKSLSQFLDTSNKLYAAGRQTYEGAQQAEAEIQKMWDGFLEDAQKFGEQGRKQATVAQQAIETLSPTFKRVIYEIQQQINSLKPPSVRAVESVTNLAAYREQLAANTAQHVTELQAEAAAINDQIQQVEIQIAAQEYLGNSTAELNAQLQELIYRWDDVQNALNPVIPTIYSFAQAVKSVSENLVPDKTLGFLDQVLNATSGAANLEKALSVLENIGTPVAIIIDRLGGDIETFAKALEESGLPIPPLIQKYLKLKDASDNAGKDLPRIADSLSVLVGRFVEKVRKYVNGDTDLTKGILDAIGALLTGLPSNAKTTGITATFDSSVKEAVDRVRLVEESILATLKAAGPPAGADVRAAADYLPGFNAAVTPNPVVQQFNITVNDNEQITNEFSFTAEIDRQTVRDEIIPEITEVLTNNTDSTREKWIRIIRGAGRGVSAK